MLNILIKFASLKREIERIEAISKSPIITFFTETLKGIPVIRAFDKVD